MLIVSKSIPLGTHLGPRAGAGPRWQHNLNFGGRGERYCDRRRRTRERILLSPFCRRTGPGGKSGRGIRLTVRLAASVGSSTSTGAIGGWLISGKTLTPS